MSNVDGDQYYATLNQWLLSLPEERRKILVEDRWMLAEAALRYGRAHPSPSGWTDERKLALENALRLVQCEEIMQKILELPMVQNQLGYLHKGIGTETAMGVLLTLEKYSQQANQGFVAVPAEPMKVLLGSYPTDMGDDGSGRAGFFPHITEAVGALRKAIGEHHEC